MVWLLIFIFDQVYIKHVISTVKMSTWTRVYYQNLLSGIPVALMAIAWEGFPMILCTGWKARVDVAVGMLVISCGMSIAISYFSFSAREALSATGFTVAGNACKFISVLVNVIIWRKHATIFGIIALCFSLVSSAFYQVAPERKNMDKKVEQC